MGTHKQAAINKGQKKWKVSPDEVRIERRNQLGETLDTVCHPLLVAIYESEKPVVQITFKCKADGSWLVILKRDTSDGAEVLFSGGEDFLESVIRVGEKVAKGQWKEETPWTG